jgi:hypothetical protein
MLAASALIFRSVTHGLSPLVMGFRAESAHVARANLCVIQPTEETAKRLA